MLKRLLGFLVILVCVLVLLALLPKPGEKPQTGAVPIAAIPIGRAATPMTATDSQGTPSMSDGVVSTTGTSPTASVRDNRGKQAPDTQVPVAQTPPPASETAPVSLAASSDRRAASGDGNDATQGRTTTRSAASGGDYYVQVASFQDADNAASALAGLRAHGHHGIVRATMVGGHTWHRVQVGPYADIESAQTAQRRLASQGYKGSRIVER